MYDLAPSILSADFARLGDEIKAVEDAGARYLHIDVMDGMFVPSISFGLPVIKSVRHKSRCIFDVHLMIEQPERYIEQFAAAGADIITVHAEACVHLDRVIAQIKSTGKRAGVALNPATSLTALEYVLPQTDVALVMSVNPGFANQKYIGYSTDKIKALRKMIRQRGLNTAIEVDGGINEETILLAAGAGADILVAGSAVFGADTAGNAKKYLKILREYAGGAK